MVNFGCPFPSSRAESIDFVVKTTHTKIHCKSLAFLSERRVSLEKLMSEVLLFMVFDAIILSTNF